MNWRDCKIGDLGRVVTGKTPVTSEARFYGVGYPFVTPTDMDFMHFYLNSTQTQVTPEARQTHSRQFIPRNAVMFTCIGNTIGKCAIADTDCLTNQQINSVVVNDENDPKFVYYRLVSKISDIRAIASGAATPIINKSAFEGFVVCVPAKREQQRIAAALSAYDDLIAINKRRITLLEDAARRLYREWFVHLRFPGHESVPVKDGVPEGWERGSLDSALFLQRGFDLPNGSRIPGDVPVYASTGINGFHNEAKAVCPGVVTGRSGTLGQVHYVTKDYWPLNTSLWVKEFRRVSPILAYFLLSELKLEQFNSGASVPTLDRKTVHQASVLVPSPEVVTQFDALVQPLFDQIEMLKSSIATNAQARDLLLPKLMSGQLDVSGIALPDEVAA